MKTIQKYQCEFCEAILDTEAKAKKCEETHPDSLEIIEISFDEHKAEPTEITLSWNKIPGTQTTGAVYTLNRLITKGK